MESTTFIGTAHSFLVHSQVAFHDAQQLLISCSVDKTVKLWDMRMQRCLQTVADKTKYRPEDRLSAFAFDSHRGQLFTASTALRPWPLIKRARRAIEAGHDHPVIAALYNPNFHQVVSGDEAAQVIDCHYCCGSLRHLLATLQLATIALD